MRALSSSVLSCLSAYLTFSLSAYRGLPVLSSVSTLSTSSTASTSATVDDPDARRSSAHLIHSSIHTSCLGLMHLHACICMHGLNVDGALSAIYLFTGTRPASSGKEPPMGAAGMQLRASQASQPSGKLLGARTPTLFHSGLH
jgi:hypothetical protein